MKIQAINPQIPVKKQQSANSNISFGQVTPQFEKLVLDWMNYLSKEDPMFYKYYINKVNPLLEKIKSHDLIVDGYRDDACSLAVKIGRGKEDEKPRSLTYGSHFNYSRLYTFWDHHTPTSFLEAIIRQLGYYDDGLAKINKDKKCYFDKVEFLENTPKTIIDLISNNAPKSTINEIVEKSKKFSDELKTKCITGKECNCAKGKNMDYYFKDSVSPHLV